MSLCSVVIRKFRLLRVVRRYGGIVSFKSWPFGGPILVQIQNAKLDRVFFSDLSAFGTVAVLKIDGCQFSTQDLRLLSTCRDFCLLSLRGTAVTDTIDSPVSIRDVIGSFRSIGVLVITSAPNELDDWKSFESKMQNQFSGFTILDYNAPDDLAAKQVRAMVQFGTSEEQ